MCHVLGAYLAKIAAYKIFALLLAKCLVNSKVPQIKERVAHRGIFPIKNPDSLSIIDEVAGQQIIVARARSSQRTNRLLDLLHQRVHLWQRSGKNNSTLKRLLVVIAHR